ncbi:MAG: 5-keto-L-gluconate epimerase [Ignavibacteriales bacterium]|nr:5-keto-L-gluconate epimerase [Ignavibacteriales bacterium]
MKFSIVLSTQPTAFSALAYKGKLSENISKIKMYGYDGVELAVRDPKLLDLVELNSILRENHLPVPAIGTGQAYGEEGLSFTHPDKEIRKKAVERIKSQLKFAEQFNAIVIIGLVRGKKEAELNYEQVEDWLIEALDECASSNEKIKLAIEPIHRYETNIINTVNSGMLFLEKLNKKNVGLLLDSFHMNIEEPLIIESIKNAREKLFHFHVADSNRWYPGAGHIDFKSILETLEKIKYTGFVSAEIMPLPDSDTAAKRTINFLQELSMNR